MSDTSNRPPPGDPKATDPKNLPGPPAARSAPLRESASAKGDPHDDKRDPLAPAPAKGDPHDDKRDPLAPAPVKETPEQADKRVKAEYKAKAARLYAAFGSPEIGLGEVPASILAAHVMETADAPEHMGATEAIAWANNFKQQNPIVWAALRIGHMANLTASMRRADLESVPTEHLAEAAAIIRG